MRNSMLLVGMVASVMAARTSSADDWPQWLGPNGDSVWREKGIVTAFPPEGLKVKWRAPVGLGYAGPAVAGGRVYLFDYVKRSGDLTNNPGLRNKLEGSERIVCLAAESGDLIWEHRYDRAYRVSYSRGPRCTPTVVSGKVYTLGTEGTLLCLNATDGTVVWKKELTKEYGSETPQWGFAAHPLVVGNMLYCLAGGEGSLAVALNKDTGREIWRALSADELGYCPPTMIEHGGTKQLLIWPPDALSSLDPRTGQVHWSVPLKPTFGMSIATPRKLGELLYVSGVGNAGALIKLDSQKPAASVLWRGNPKNAVYCTNSTPFLEAGIIYGCDTETGALMGVRMQNGERLWQTFKPTTGNGRARYGTAFLVKHEDRFFLFSETGDLILAKLSAQGYDELGRFHVLEPTNEAFRRRVVWSHPAFAEKSVFARNDKELVCVDLAATE